MLPMAFALAAEKTAEASYAIYLWCAGGGVVLFGGGGLWYCSGKSSGRSENDIAVDIELGIQQQQPLEFAADTLLNVDEQTQTVLIQQAEHLEVLGDSIHQLNGTLLHAADSTAQIGRLIQPLHETAMNAETTVQTMALELKRSEEERASITHELGKTQSALNETERQLHHSVNHLTTSQAQLTATSNAVSRQLQNLSSQCQATHNAWHPSIDLKEHALIDALNQTIDEQAQTIDEQSRLLLELSEENDALQERINAYQMKQDQHPSEQPTKGSAFTLFSRSH